MYAIQNRKVLFGDNEHTSSVKAGTFLEIPYNMEWFSNVSG
jgi:hypothetical protein